MTDNERYKREMKPHQHLKKKVTGLRSQKYSGVYLKGKKRKVARTYKDSREL